MAPTSDPKRFEQLKATGNLPSPKGVALAIIRLTQREDVTLVELANVIKSDPAFVGRLIKAANGVLQLGRRPVVSVQESLLVLGLPAVRTLALGFSLLNSYRRGACRAFDYPAYWSGSVIMAIAAQYLSQRVRVAAADEMFSLGLLAQVGRLALANLYPDAFGALLQSLAADRAALRRAERESFAVDHGELTGLMLSDWGLPRVFVDAAANYEACVPGDDAADGSRDRQLMMVLALADGLAGLLLSGDEAEDEARLAALLPMAEELGMDDAALRAFIEQILPEWQSWAGMLDLPAQIAPRRAVPAPAPAPVPVAEGETLPLQSPVRPRPPRGEEERLRVLVVDDDAAIRATTMAVLAEQGHLVFEAQDGNEGLERALEILPDMMLVDWVMPRMDGLELVRSLRAARQGRGIYILLLTVLEDEARLVEAFEAGVDDFVAKPFSPRLLAARLLAGRRVVKLYKELEQDREELRHFAAQLAVTNRRLREAALTDSLTGFPNRRYAMERLLQEWAASERSRRPLSCMLVDLDNFKQINDAEGHDAGDQVLREAASCFKQALRRQDVICRTGGDEFLVICLDTGLDAACGCAERLRGAAGGLQIRRGERTLKLTVSVGVATRDPAMADVDALIKCADRGAYMAKGRGRNAVVAAQLNGTEEGNIEEA